MNILKKIIERLRGFYDSIMFNLGMLKLKTNFLLTTGSKRLILFQTPSHTNIGDHAIAEAEIAYINRHFPNYKFIEVNQVFHFKVLEFLKGKITTNDIILLTGGGNFGNQYMLEENIRRSTIDTFKSQKILIFPQTIYYSDNVHGRNELEKTIKIFSNHNNLTLIARENISFELMKKYFKKNRILLMPDIVLTLDKSTPKLQREGILMVLRGDDEKILNESQHDKLNEIVNSISKNILYSDMHYHKWTRTQKDRDILLDYKFNQFKKAKIVITDRLHGMVFAAITQTPCVAFTNYNQKVSGTYQWIKHLNYIKFIDVDSDYETIISNLLEIENLDYLDSNIFKKYFDQLQFVINE